MDALARHVSIGTYAVALSIFFLCYFILLPIIVYIKDTKGLRKFPNFSLLSGISALPFMILAHRGARSQYLSELHHEKPILRTGPNALSFGSVRAIKDIYGHSTLCLKDESYEITRGPHHHLADVVDKNEHARKRKVLSMAYAIKHLVAWEHKVADKVQRLIAHIDSCCTMPPAGEEINDPAPEDLNVDLRQWVNFFSLDAIADIGLSERLGLLDRGHDMVQGQLATGKLVDLPLRQCLYPTARKQSLLLWAYSWYPTLDKISNVIPFYRRMSESSRGWDAIVLRRVMLRKARYDSNEEGLDDFFTALMESKSAVPNNLPFGEVRAEVNIMLNAGSVTTAIAITNVLYQLLRHRDVLEKLQAEIDQVMEPNEVVASYEKMRTQPYLKACLDESLRLWPPTPHGLPRKTPPGGMHIMGEWIPGNTTVSISALVAHRDPEAFDQPDKFIPERWLGEEGKKLQSSFIAFSTGARGCIGRNISYLEQTVCISSLLHRFDFTLAKGFELKRLETMNHILGEMPVKVWRRKLGAKA
ncbi:cytochrome P450 [Rhizodiscina lignyota]|uniref:Cytochrome P450 n=1 Tax=Rhizodiscina lignyota TaxID=1504668 RepID=A0A9P4MCC1_9PEZI|nr:cytochrome P450 [Rhizodiscina lignyota]